MRSLFLTSLSQNIAVLSPVITSLSENWIKSVQTCISCINGNRNMKVNSNGKFNCNIRFKNHYLKMFIKLVQNVQIQVLFDPILR